MNYIEKFSINKEYDNKTPNNSHNTFNKQHTFLSYLQLTFYKNWFLQVTRFELARIRIRNE